MEIRSFQLNEILTTAATIELQATLELSKFPAAELWMDRAEKISTFNAPVAGAASGQGTFASGNSRRSLERIVAH